MDFCISCMVPGCSKLERKDCIRNGKQNFPFAPLVNELFANSNLVVIKKKIVGQQDVNS